MSIYQKLSLARQELAKKKIVADTKGYNYNYIDLPQIESAVSEACLKAGIIATMTFNNAACMSISELEGDGMLMFESPLIDPAMVHINDKQPIQNVGGLMTYMRRYMYMMVFAISEHDAVEEVGSEQKKNEDAKELGKKIAEKMKEEKVDKPMSEEELKERCDMIDFFVQLDPHAVEKLMKVKKVSSVGELETDYLRKIYKAKKGDNK